MLRNVGFTGMLTLGAVAFAAEDLKNRPNILFLFTDDHAPAAMSCYGSKVNKTPNMDRIAKEGAIFNRCYVANAISGPSRACIMTGMHSHANGFLDNYTAKITTDVRFPKYLQAAGYNTALIGKWHLGDGENPTNYGFNYWMVYRNQGQYYSPDYRTKNGPVRADGKYSVEATTDYALDWIKEQKNDKEPWLLMCQYKAPHRNWLPGPKYHELYKNETIPEPENLHEDWTKGNRNSRLKDNTMSVKNHLTISSDLKYNQENNCSEWGRMTPEQKIAWTTAYKSQNDWFTQNKPTGKELVSWKYQRYMKDYLRCVAAVDDNIGRILKYLDDTGLAKNTIVIYSSDQGFFLGEHGLYDKRYMYEETLKMPFLIRWPGVIKPNSKRNQIIQNIDFAPTFLEIAGIEKPKEMQGTSIVPVLKDNKKKLRDFAYYQYYETPSEHGVPAHFGITGDNFKLIHYYAWGQSQMDEWEMYDLKKDPQEMTNIFDDPKYLKERGKLLKKIAEERKRLNVPEGERFGNMGKFEKK